MLESFIATIPEATIEAIKTLKSVNLLILGGMDRGVNFDHLVDFLSKGPVDKIVLTGQAGSRLRSLLESRMEKNHLFTIRSFDELPFLIKKYIPKGGVCLLSPAAASYGLFRNFEERGNIFKKIVKSL
jgi:UDP-N-acetylmuramoylalanine--D-glutamate ligase